jgi:hypothetical protein
MPLPQGEAVNSSPFFLYFFFGGPVVWTQGLALAWQVLYYMSHATSSMFM